ncbi:adenylate/guanylate cyclase domain-containing protein [Lichenibacterium dinghuense]|uniref:adenylate/guanylate cyclase domain-containing protein n=1 Tax=Lichenibacterium dinghuense TaxID=2895977 RepID=UPI001F4015DB|nr:adenylate/guanylate cyclase domain-containing protein [Lichenibacterium sp. 6Y81]
MPLPLPAWPDALRTRSLRIWSGAVLGLYLVTHFADIALGLVSLRAMDRAGPWLGGFWHAPPGTALLLGALLVHFGLSLRALHRRRTLRMTAREATQLGLGLALPFLILPHVVAARIVPALTGLPMTYADQVRALWVINPPGGARQVVALLVRWVHGCFGFWFALRARPWFGRWSGPLLAAALLVPVLALLGFAEAGREVAALPWHPRPRAGPAPSAEALRDGLALAFAAPIAAVLLARGARLWLTRHRRFRVTYPDGRSVSAPRGSTVLEASRIGGVPHVSLCGGRGRCSTCRVRVTAGLDHLPDPDALERATLERSNAAPGLRLACQLRPTRDLAVMPVFAPPRARGAGAPAPRPASASQERELAVLFCDLRGFTHRVERWLPFDTVFLLNRYFEIVGEAVEEAGGHLDKFIGDGALALFGLDAAPEAACRQALAAAAGVARGLGRMNDEFAAELGEPLRIAMGLHLGSAVVGDMGYGQAVGLTAVGDGINVASRLEGVAKERDVEAVVSAAVLSRAGREVPRGLVHAIAVRGRAAAVDAVLVADAAALGGPDQADSASGRG